MIARLIFVLEPTSFLNTSVFAEAQATANSTFEYLFRKCSRYLRSTALEVISFILPHTSAFRGLHINVGELPARIAPVDESRVDGGWKIFSNLQLTILECGGQGRD